MAKKEHPFPGNWRIVWMEAWDEEYFDMEVPAHISIRRDNLGAFHFGNVQGEIDGRIETRNGQPRFAFSWAGSAELDDACGRGWAEREGNELTGCIYFHMGEESAFKASREQ